MELITKEFNIKGMICSRCLKILIIEFKAIDVRIIDISLGKIILKYNPEKIHYSTIEEIIKKNEFEVIGNQNEILADQVKRTIIEYIWSSELHTKLSEYITARINRNYDTLSKLFTNSFDKTIREYSVLLKMERVKELIEYDEMNFSDIAYALGYKNPSALSRQFKKITGISLKEYKNSKEYKRRPIDKI